jgi:hypothetical protein
MNINYTLLSDIMAPVTGIMAPVTGIMAWIPMISPIFGSDLKRKEMDSNTALICENLVLLDRLKQL